jgi:hypothetical protein
VTEQHHPLIRDLAPSLVEEMKQHLDDLGETAVSAKVEPLEAWGRCTCGDDFCSSFYTGPRPLGTWSDEGDHRTTPLPVHEGMVNLDILSGEIRYVEVIDRPDLARAVGQLPALPRRS